MATWISSEIYRYVWISVFFILIVLFNVLNVRRFGEIEYWMAVVKLATIVGLIILGVLLPMGVSTQTRELATSANLTVEVCSSAPATFSEGLANATCLVNPGFDCIAPPQYSPSPLPRCPSRDTVVDLYHRLENRPCIQKLLLPRLTGHLPKFPLGLHASDLLVHGC